MHEVGRCGGLAAQPVGGGLGYGDLKKALFEHYWNHFAAARARRAERETGRIFMVAVSDRRAVDATASTDPLRYANHACEPNMVLKVQQGRVAFYALRDIAAGEELTARYGATHHGGRLVCRCGSPRCIGRL